MKNILFFAILFFAVTNASAQQKKLITDTYAGFIPAKKCTEVFMELTLTHERYSDEGTYTLKQRCPSDKDGIYTEGEWTVLRGDATNENATVVELGLKGNWHFRREKNGNLQLLDSTLHVVGETGRYILKKR
jgi:hypothetical protein